MRQNFNEIRTCIFFVLFKEFFVKVFNCDICRNFQILTLGKIIECGSSIKYAPSKLKLESGRCPQCQENYTIS